MDHAEAAAPAGDAPAGVGGESPRPGRPAGTRRAAPVRPRHLAVPWPRAGGRPPGARSRDRRPSSWSTPHSSSSTASPSAGTRMNRWSVSTSERARVRSPSRSQSEGGSGRALEIWATDVSDDALAVARANRERLARRDPAAAGRVTLAAGDSVRRAPERVGRRRRPGGLEPALRLRGGVLRARGGRARLRARGVLSWPAPARAVCPGWPTSRRSWSGRRGGCGAPGAWSSSSRRPRPTPRRMLHVGPGSPGRPPGATWRVGCGCSWRSADRAGHPRGRRWRCCTGPQRPWPGERWWPSRPTPSTGWRSIRRSRTRSTCCSG